MSESLKDKTVKGVGWSAIDNGAQYVVAFVVSIVLARLLTPDEYGLMGIVAIFTTLSNTIINGGFYQALVRKKEVTEDDYSTVFISNLFISLLLYLILFFSAPFIAKFFSRPELVDLTRVMSLSIVLGAFAIVQRARLTRLIDFKTQAKVTLITGIVSGIIGISMAFCGWGVWALVAQGISYQLCTSILLLIFNRWTPKFNFSKTSFHDLFGFSWKLLVSGIIDSLWKEFSQIVIGKFYSAETLGQYTRAKHFGTLFSSNLTSIVQRVSYPALSKLQDEKERLKNAYKKVIKATMYVTFFLMMALAACAGTVVPVLVGDQWLSCVPYLEIMCFSLMLYPLHAINLNMLEVQGRSDLFLKLEIVKKTIGIIPLLLGIFVDIYWMLGTGVIVGVISYWLNARYSGPLLNYSIVEQVKDIAPSFISAIIMAVLVFFIGLINISPFILLPIQMLFAIVFYIILGETTRIEEYVEVKGMITTLCKGWIKKQ